MPADPLSPLQSSTQCQDCCACGIAWVGPCSQLSRVRQQAATGGSSPSRWQRAHQAAVDAAGCVRCRGDRQHQSQRAAGAAAASEQQEAGTANQIAEHCRRRPPMAAEQAVRGRSCPAGACGVPPSAPASRSARRRPCCHRPASSGWRLRPAPPRPGVFVEILILRGTRGICWTWGDTQAEPSRA